MATLKRQKEGKEEKKKKERKKENKEERKKESFQFVSSPNSRYNVFQGIEQFCS